MSCDSDPDFGDYCIGYIFKSGNTFQVIMKEGNIWTEAYSDTYTISGNVIMIDGDPATYSVSSDGKKRTLTFTENGETYTGRSRKHPE